MLGHELTPCLLCANAPERSPFDTLDAFNHTRFRIAYKISHSEKRMSIPAIITVAITGSVPRKKDTPAVPITPEEQIESTHEAFEAGASLVHIHVRNADESPSSDPALFQLVQEGIRKHCPGMIIQFSTGGAGARMRNGPGHSTSSRIWRHSRQDR